MADVTQPSTGPVEAHLPATGPWPRVFAALYGPVIGLVELAGAGAARADAVGRARGRTLEIGAGAGHALPHYPEAVGELVLTEPDASMLRRLQARVAAAGRPARVVRAAAEELPFADGSFDTVVCNLVLCTAPDPRRALREAHRVLRPDGQFLFLEHVRSERPRAARWQDRVAGPWRRFACGCNCNLDTVATIAAGPLALAHVDRRSLALPGPIRPIVVGRAVRAA